MFRGFHRLQNYDFLISRTKDMNYLVLKSYLNHLNFHFKILYCNHVILLHNKVLHFPRIPLICYLQFLDLQKIFYAFYKF
jgi:hypothetical protein